MQILFFILLFVIYIIYIFITLKNKKSLKSESVDDYFLANRGLNLFQTTISLIATQLGGGFILGISQDSYQFGYYGLFYTIGVSLGFLILGFGTASKLRLFNINTVSQIFEVYYGSKFLRKASAIISILSMIGIFTAQIVGAKSLLLSLNLYNPILFIILWILIILYVVIGGLKAIVKNDIMQLCLIIIIFYALFFSDFIMSFSSSLNILKSGFSSKLFLVKSANIAKLLPIAVMPALYSLVEQDLAQIFFASKYPKYAKLSALFASLFLIIFAIIPLYFGIKAKVMGIDVAPSCNPLISLFEKSYNILILALLAYGILAAIISTGNSILNAISSSVVKDFELFTNFKDSVRVSISKAITMSIGCLGLLLTFCMDNIVKILVGSYSLTVTSGLVSILAVYILTNKCNNYQIKLPKLAAYCSFFSGAFVFIVSLVFKVCIIISPEFDSLIVSFIFYLLGYLIDYFLSCNYGKMQDTLI